MCINEEFTMRIESLMQGNMATFQVYCESLNGMGYQMFKQWLMNTNEVTSDMRNEALLYLTNSRIGRSV